MFFVVLYVRLLVPWAYRQTHTLTIVQGGIKNPLVFFRCNKKELYYMIFYTLKVFYSIGYGAT